MSAWITKVISAFSFNVRTKFVLSFTVVFTAVLLLVSLVFVGTHAFAAAGINPLVNFQGKLVNTNGTNVADGSYSVVFTLYDAASAGTNLWSETQTVTTTDGIFHIALGSVTSLSTVNFNSDSLYLGIKVGSDAEMTPRIRFASVPYAFNAQKVNGLTVTNTSSNPFSSTTTLQIGDGKTVVFNNGLTFSGTDSTAFTFPTASDTVVGAAATQTLTNKTIGSTGLVFSGAATDITTGTNEDLTISPNGTGNTIFASGNVGIGSTSPGNFKLEIAGNIGPDANGTRNLGSPSRYWNNLYVNNIFSSLTGVSGYLQRNLGALSPANITDDFLLGGTATSSAKFAFLNMAAGTPTASISGNLSLQIPTTSSPATALNILNGGSFNIQTATVGQGDAGLNSRFFIANSGNIGIGTTSPQAQLAIEKASYTTTQALISNGVTGAPPTYPNSWLPTLTIQTNETSGSRPLFFGYNNAGVWASYLSSGACGSFSNMCLDLGNGATAYTALENTGSTLYVGGGNDGNFSNVALAPTSGNVGIGTSSPVSLFDVNRKFNVLSGGNVGIGSTSPSTLLALNGGIGSENGYNFQTGGSDNMLVNGDFEQGTYGWTGLTGTTNTATVSGTLAAQVTGSSTVESTDYIPVDPVHDVIQLEGWFQKTVAGTQGGNLYFGYKAYDSNKNVITSSPCGTYCYFAASNATIPVDGQWHKFSATTTGVGTSFPDFPVGTAYIRVLGLVNYANTSGDAVTLIDHVSVKRLNYGPLFIGNNFASSNMEDQTQVTQAYTTAANNFIIQPPTGGNVGIGSTTPAYKLDVSGTARISGQTTLSNYTTAGGILFTDGSGVVTQNSGITFNTTYNRLTINPLASSFSGLDVSYAPTSSAAPLRLMSTASTGYFHEVISNANTEIDLGVQGSEGYAKGVNNFWLGAGNVNKVIYLTATGNVGIGGTSPTTGVTSPKALVDIEGGNTGGNALLLLNQLGATTNDIFTASSSSTPRFTIANDGTITATKYTTNGGLLYANGSGVVAQSGAGTGTQCLLGGTTPTWGACSTGGGITGSGTTNYLAKFTGTGTIGTSVLYDNGTNVGIGLTAPTSLLHLYGSGGSTKGLELQSSGANSPTTYLYPGTATPDSGFLQFGDGSGWKFYMGSSANTKLVTFQDNGNVGIGTTTLSQKLTVSGGNIQLTDTGGKLYLTDGNHYLNYDGSNTNFIFNGGNFNFSNGTTNITTITGAGNVGIGTTAPSALLNTNQTMTLAGSSQNGIVFNQTFSGVPTASLNSIGLNNTTSINFTRGNFTQWVYGRQDSLNLTNPYTIDNAYAAADIFNNNSTAVDALTGYTATSAAALNAVASNNVTGRIHSLYGGNMSVGNSTGTVDNGYGIYSSVNNNSSGTITNGYGGYFQALSNNSSSTYTTGYGLYAMANAGATNSSMGTAYGLYSTIATASATTAGGINTAYGGRFDLTSPINTNAYGIYSNVTDVTRGTNYGAYINTTGSVTDNYGIYIAGTPAAAGNYGIYEAASAQNYFAGNVGIGTTAPNGKLEIAGALALPYSDGTSGRVYYNVFSHFDGGNPDTGTYAIVLPNGWNSTFMHIIINGYQYTTPGGAWQVRIGGYNFNGGGWYSTSAAISGDAPFSKVRLAYDGTHVVILLGTTTTTWNYPEITVSEFDANNNTTNWASGWTASFVTNESSYTNINTPPTTILSSSQLTFGGALQASISPAAGQNLTIQAGDTSHALILQGSGGNVGIGSTNPIYLLDVNGTFRSSSTSNAVFGNGTTGGIQLGDAAITKTSGSAFQMNSGLTMTQNLTVNGTGSNYFAGNVGIGSTSPLALLDLQQTGNSKGIVNINGDGNQPLLTASVSGTPKFIIDKAGNVGIGTISPGSKFNIVDSPFTLNASNATGLQVETTQTNAWTNLGTNTPSLRILEWYDSGNNPLGTIDGVGNVGIGTTSPLAKLDLQQTGNSKAIVNINGDGNQTLFTASISGTTKFILDKTGNVGIGTSSPQSPLDVEINTDATTAKNLLTLGNNFTGQNNQYTFKIDSGKKLHLNSGSSSNSFNFDNTAGSNVFAVTNTGALSTAGQVTFSNYTGNNAILFGTAGTGVLAAATTSTAGQCLVSGASSTYLPTWGSCSAGGSTAWSAIVAPTTNLSLAMSTFTTAFNWATGTSTNNLFSLTTDASANGTGALLNIQTGTSSTVIPLRVRAGSTEALYVDASGNVGIGTTGPQSKLHVSGGNMLLDNTHNLSFLDTGGSANAYLNYTSGNNLQLENTASTGSVQIGPINASGAIQFITGAAGNEQARIDANGNLGIGTTAPEGVLTVKGGNIGGNAALIVNQTGASTNDLFTASSSGTTKFTIANDGTMTDKKYGWGVAQFSGTGVVSSTALNLAGGSFLISGTLPVGNGGTGTNTAFTPGSVVFAGTSGVYSQDNANFYYDTANDRLGLGTTTPNQQLHLVKNNANAVMQFQTTSTGTNVGPNGTSSGVDDATVGTVAWTNPGNVTASDNTYATQALGTSTTGHYLKATGFGFSIPSNATITGITVEVERSDTAFLTKAVDNSIKIVKGGTITGTDKSTGASWPGSDTFATFGSSGDLWGTTWTYSDINAANFGVVISAKNTSPLYSASPQIDYIRITVTYTIGANATSWTQGIDYSNGGLFKISNGTALGTNDYFTIDQSGNVGIGTTAPGYGLDLQSSATATAAAQIFNTNTGGNAQGLIVKLGFTGTGTARTGNTTGNSFIQFQNGTGTPFGAIDVTAANTLTYRTGGWDFAEYFPKADVNESLPEGTVVCYGDNGGTITTCSDTHNQIVGVISGQAGFSGGAEHAYDPAYAQVGLLGHLPVTVTTENGGINVGDGIVASKTLPGGGAKAITAGYIVGRATEAVPVGSGPKTITVLVQPMYSDPSVFLMGDGNLTIAQNAEQQFELRNASGELFKNKAAFADAAIANLSAGKIKAQSLEVDGSLVLNGKTLDQYIQQSTQSQTASAAATLDTSAFASASAVTKLSTSLGDLTKRVSFLENQASISAVLGASTSSLDMTKDATFSGSLMVLGKTTVNDLGVTGKIVSGLMAIDGLEGTLDVVGQPLKLQSSGFGSVDILDGKVVISDDGSVTVHGGITADTIKVKQVIIDQSDSTSKSVGDVTIPAGTTSIDVQSSALASTSHIFVTPERPVAVSAVKKDSTTFTISLEKASAQNLKVSWWIVN